MNARTRTQVTFKRYTMKINLPCILSSIALAALAQASNVASACEVHMAAKKNTGRTLAKASRASFTGISLKDLRGKPIKTEGAKAILLTNIASKCGYTGQLGDLQKLHKKYADQGLLVIGFPSNDFKQEPLAGTEIKEFCRLKYGVDFPVAEKGRVAGEQAHEVFTKLTETAADKGPVKWNFEKFLVTENGSKVQRFRSKIEPMDPEVTTAIEAGLKETKTL